MSLCHTLSCFVLVSTTLPKHPHLYLSCEHDLYLPVSFPDQAPSLNASSRGVETHELNVETSEIPSAVRWDRLRPKQ